MFFKKKSAVETLAKKENDGVIALTGEELIISRVGHAAWRRKRGEPLNSEQQSSLEQYEKENGVVWWDNVRQFKEGGNGN